MTSCSKFQEHVGEGLHKKGSRGLRQRQFVCASISLATSVRQARHKEAAGPNCVLDVNFGVWGAGNISVA